MIYGDVFLDKTRQSSIILLSNQTCHLLNYVMIVCCLILYQILKHYLAFVRKFVYNTSDVKIYDTPVDIFIIYGVIWTNITVNQTISINKKDKFFLVIYFSYKIKIQLVKYNYPFAKFDSFVKTSYVYL